MCREIVGNDSGVDGDIESGRGIFTVGSGVSGGTVEVHGGGCGSEGDVDAGEVVGEN